MSVYHFKTKEEANKHFRDEMEQGLSETKQMIAELETIKETRQALNMQTPSYETVLARLVLQYENLLEELDKRERALQKEKKAFVPMLNGTATNQLSSINTRKYKPLLDTITGNATIKIGTLKVFIDQYQNVTGRLKTSTYKLLDACTMQLTKQNDYKGNQTQMNATVRIPLEKYMEWCGAPNTKASKDKTRRKVKEDLDTLYHISLEWTENSKKNIKDFSKTRICTKVGIEKGMIIFSFSPEMAKYLTEAYIMQYATDLLKVDERNANAYALGKKLLLHHSIYNNQKKGTAHTISVRCLLENCPDIPTYEQVSKAHRHLDQRIKTPFETALNALPFVQWEYTNAKGVPLTTEQLNTKGYDTFVGLYVKYDIINAPEQTTRRKINQKASKPKT